MEQRTRKLEELERPLRRSAAGAEIASAIEAHIEEVIDLVTHNRRVGAAWQRNQGPAYIRAVLDSGFEEDVPIPRAVSGVRLEELLLRMGDALQRHGSVALRRTIAERALQILTWARDCSSLRDLFRRLEALDREARP